MSDQLATSPPLVSASAGSDMSLSTPSISVSPAQSFTSNADSGVGGVFDSPKKPQDALASKDGSQDVESGNESDAESEETTPNVNDEVEDKEDSDGEDVDDNDKADSIPSNPFDNEQSRILFDAMDKLHTWASEYLDIPKLVIVGSQSSGKSSLLQTLTDIPFPIGERCCTRFPTRIVSRRTEPGSEDSYCITVQDPEVTVKGLQPADEHVKQFVRKGTTLTMEKFEKYMNEVAFEKMGIKKGQGKDKKNFVANVLKVELSGPNRSHFSILDIPGIFASKHNVNSSEVAAVKEMATKYMQRQENIVICVADATNDLSNQEVFDLALEHVDKKRLVGVFTKCDRLTSADETVSIALGKTDDGGQTMHNGWFVVRNRGHLPPTADLSAAEQELFEADPWTSIPSSRRGSAALKLHLGQLLSKSIRSAFPKIEESINMQLVKGRWERTQLGDPRETTSERQQYLNQVVQEFCEMSKLALERSGFLEKDSLEVGREIGRLSTRFNTLMRQYGHTWDFEDADVTPETKLTKVMVPGFRQPETYKTPLSSQKIETQMFDKPASKENLFAEITRQLSNFPGPLPGVINNDIYPVIYNKQTSKWAQICEKYLFEAGQAVRACVTGIIHEVCPPNGGTAILHNELMATVERMLGETMAEARARLEEYCVQETQPRVLKTTDWGFGERLTSWRRARFAEAYMEVSRQANAKAGDPNKPDEMALCLSFFNLIHSTVEVNMAKDVHDVVKVYYQLSITSFIRFVTYTIVEGFVSHEKGPLKGLNGDYVLGLSEAELERLTREDSATVERRRELDVRVARLGEAKTIAQQASYKTSILGEA